MTHGWTRCLCKAGWKVNPKKFTVASLKGTSWRNQHVFLFVQTKYEYGSVRKSCVLCTFIVWRFIITVYFYQDSLLLQSYFNPWSNHVEHGTKYLHFCDLFWHFCLQGGHSTRRICDMPWHERHFQFLKSMNSILLSAPTTIFVISFTKVSN